MVDLQLTAERATAVEAAAVDAVVEPGEAVVRPDGERRVLAGAGRRHERRHLLLPALHALQHAVGWISPGGLNLVADRLQVPPAEVFGVASFYDLFRTDDPGHDRSVIHVCVDAACLVAGSRPLLDRLAADGTPVVPSPCLGQCERAPATFVQGRGEPDVVPADEGEVFVHRQRGEPGLRLTSRLGVVDPASLDSYREHGGYAALDRAIGLGPDGVTDALAAAGLSGRGGAACPTGTKWRAVADQPGAPKFVVANCDESEPGTFKDRVLLEHDP
ncbi:MAG: NAD(P)H-dependent oxidoreductase subunit E, partial [Acidimicrobiia bacterium]|nr:NAD(P)H-dependent oxidoreductase subunit E [Acidimicrobiia bacterium]